MSAARLVIITFYSNGLYLISHQHFFRMYPIIEKEKSVFIKCKYNEREQLFEGHLPKEVAPSGEREVSIASLCFQPKLLSEKRPIEIGLSFGEGGNTLLRIDKGGCAKAKDVIKYLPIV